MTGQELVNLILDLNLLDWEIEAKYHGEVFDIVDLAKYEGKVRLYPQEDEE